MKKILKFMSLLLIVPVLGIGSLLTGCGKDEASIEDIRNDYNEMIHTYHYDGDGATDTDKKELESSENQLFKFKGNPVTVNEDGSYNYFKPYTVSNTEAYRDLTFDVNLGILDHDNASNEAENDLKKRYEQLSNIYGKLLTYSNIYFQRYQRDFFPADGSAPEGVDGEQLYKLQEKLDNLSDKLSAFYSNLKNRQDLAVFLGSGTEIMQTKLNTFNSVYVDLIQANFEFVLKFCDIHKNYILNADKVSEGAVTEAEIAERYTYEAALKYAYGYFLDNVKSYQNNGLCNSFMMTHTNYEFVIYKSTDGSFVKGGNDPEDSECYPENWVDNNNDGINDEVKIDGNEDDEDTILLAAGTYYKVEYKFDLKNELDEIMSNFVDGYGDLKTLTISNSKAAELKQAIARIDAFTKLYKTNISNFDMYTYNLIRTNSSDTIYDSEQEFEDSLSASEKARKTIIEDYATYDLTLLANAINAMFN